MEFSIIVPIYNVEAYLKRCLNSIKDQTFNSYEVIMVDDGSSDSSSLIMASYHKKDERFKPFFKKNGGLSDARNYGVKKATGKYILFLDSDDYLGKNLLSELHDVLIKDHDPDVIRYRLAKMENENKLTYSGCVFSNRSSDVAFPLLIREPYFEPAWIYAYNREFFVNHHFTYKVGAYHEDFGLTPYIILKAKTISSISYIGYYYCIRENSITTLKNIENLKKRAYDVLEQYHDLLASIKVDLEISESLKECAYSYLTNAVYLKANILNGKEKREYLAKLKEEEAYQYLQSKTLGHKVKKCLIKMWPELYLMIWGR